MPHAPLLPHVEPLTVTKTQRGFPYAEFKDRYDVPCSIQDSSIATEACIWLGADEIGLRKFTPGKGWSEVKLAKAEGESYIANTRLHLTQNHVRTLLPLLAAFVDTGSIDGIPNEEEPEEEASPSPEDAPTMCVEITPAPGALCGECYIAVDGTHVATLYGNRRIAFHKMQDADGSIQFGATPAVVEAVGAGVRHYLRALEDEAAFEEMPLEPGTHTTTAAPPEEAPARGVTTQWHRSMVDIRDRALALSAAATNLSLATIKDPDLIMPALEQLRSAVARLESQFAQ